MAADSSLEHTGADADRLTTASNPRSRVAVRHLALGELPGSGEEVHDEMVGRVSIPARPARARYRRHRLQTA